MKDFSQNGEQKIILEYFGDFRGTALDIGANDGITLSNSRALVELGWNAVLVEPAEVPFRKLVLNNANAVFSDRVQCINAAITTQDGPLDFYSSGTHLGQGDTDLLSTTHPEELERWKRSGEKFTKTTVRGITFETLVRECGMEIAPVDMSVPHESYYARFDFISIDAEGADLDILKQIDLTAVGCRLLCVETNARGDAEFTAYAAKHGMRLLWSCFENRIYAR